MEEKERMQNKFEIFKKIQSFLYHFKKSDEIPEGEYDKFVESIDGIESVLCGDGILWIQDLKKYVDDYCRYQEMIRNETGTNMKVIEFCDRFANTKNDEYETLIVSIQEMRNDRDELLECYDRLREIFFSFTN